jgi:hypothetical protein
VPAAPLLNARMQMLRNKLNIRVIACNMELSRD